MGPVASTLAPGAYRRLIRRPRYPGFVLTVSLSRVCGGMFTTAGVLLILVLVGVNLLAAASCGLQRKAGR